MEHDDSDRSEQDTSRLEVDRRQVLIGGSALPVLLSTGSSAEAQSTIAERQGQPRTIVIQTTFNGQRRSANIDSRTSLLDLLREEWGLTGAKKGCNHGQCGACTVHVDGRHVVSCLTQAAKIDGAEVLTIGGWRPPGEACTQCNRLSSTMMRSSAVIARRARSCRLSGWYRRAMRRRPAGYESL